VNLPSTLSATSLLGQVKSRMEPHHPKMLAGRLDRIIEFERRQGG
jgi:hypothetical protein